MSGRAWLDACRADREFNVRYATVDGRPMNVWQCAEVLDEIIVATGVSRETAKAAAVEAGRARRLVHELGERRADAGPDPGVVPDPYSVWGRDPAGTDWMYGYDRVRAAIAGAVPGTAKYAKFAAHRLDAFGYGPHSYWTASAVCAAAGSESLCDAFALNEARHAERVMRHMLGPAGDRETALAVLGDLVFGFAPGAPPVRMERGSVLVPVATYLEATSRELGESWRLVNMDVHAGMVRLGLGRALRLARECIMRYVREWMGDRRAPTGITVPRDIAEWCAAAAARRGAGSWKHGDIPPCIAAARAELDRGANLSHVGRFMLAAHYTARGAGERDILDMFRGAPDFNERTSLYHIRNIKRTARPGGPNARR